LHHPNLPGNKIHYCDFNPPNTATALQDASVAAILASTVLELSGFAEGHAGKNISRWRKRFSKPLSSDWYKAALGAKGSFLLLHGVGHLPNKPEVDMPLAYGNYYFIEALKRYAVLR
jgi:hypothetical protein